MVIRALASAIAITALSSNAFAYDVRIDITGELTASTCEIDPGGNPQTKSLTLPTLSTNSLEYAGAYSGRTPLTLTVSGCTTETTATVYFEPGLNVTDAGTLTNLATTLPATNVDVQLLDGSANVLNLNTDQATYDIDGGTGEIKLFAQYYSATGNAQPGAVSTYVELSMNYN